MSPAHSTWRAGRRADLLTQSGGGLGENSTMDECLFCNIQRGLIPAIGGPVYEDDLVYAHHFHVGEGPAYLGHLLLETRRHTPSFADLAPAEAQAMGLLITRLSSALEACTGAEKV